MQGTTLLIVDDDKLWRNLTAQYFKSAYKYNTYTAATCAEGIMLADKVRPDYILLDYHLSDGNAATVCGHIRANEELKKTLILIVSGDDTRIDTAYNECQADHFILKGTQNATIRNIIQTLRRNRRDCGIIENGDLRLEAVNGGVYKDKKLAHRLSADRFRLFSLLVEKSPAFVTEEVIAKRVYNAELPGEKSTEAKILVHRLRHDLPPELGARIQNLRGSGWAYIPPQP